MYTVSHDGIRGLVGRCVATGCQVVQANVWQDPGFHEILCGSEESSVCQRSFRNTQTVVAEPVCCGDVLIGVLLLGFAGTGTLDAMDLRFLDIVARRVSIALAKLDHAQRVEAALIQKTKLSDLAMLTAGVSHGIRNPLQTVRAALEVVQKTLARIEIAEGDRSKVAERLTIAQNSLSCAFHLINRLVRWATPQGDPGEPVRIDEILGNLAELVRGEFEQRKIDLRLDIPQEVPAVAASIEGVRVAFDDLFWNAAKAMPSGGTLTISVENDPSAGQLVVTFSDTGTGMAQEQVDSLFAFSPFEPLPPGGRGLGLYLTRKMMDAAGGSIVCSSVEGKGTTFTLRFPLPNTASGSGV
jgi:signal transduction histidine kinase